MKRISVFSLLALCIAANAPALRAQWMQTSGPVGGSVTCLASIGTNIFAGSYDGAGVFLSTNNGTSWKSVDSGFANTPVRAFAVSGSNLFAGTDNGVFLTFNNGTSWVNVGMNVTRIYSLAVTTSSNGGTNLFASGSSPFLVGLSTNNGASWKSPTNTGLTAAAVYALAAGPNASGGTALFAGTNAGVFFTTNDAASWTTFNTGLTNTSVHVVAVGPDGAGGTKVFVGTSGGGVFRMSQDGSTWVAASTGLSNLNVISLTASGTSLFAGTEGGAFVSTDGGRTWTSINAGLSTTHVAALAYVSTGSGASLFAGTDRGIFLSVNNGTNWTATNSGLINTTVYALTTSGSNLFAGTYGGGVLLSTNSGSTWTAVNSGLTNTIVDAFLVLPASAGSGTNLFAGTAGGVFLSTNNGSSWTPANTGLTSTTVLALVAAPAASGSGVNVFAGTAGGVFLSTNNGTSWSAVSTGLTSPLVLSLAASGTNLYAGTQDGGVFLSTNNGSSWKPVSTGLTNATINALAVLPTSAGGTNVFAGTQGSGVFLSTNNGATWSSVGLGSQEVWAFAVYGTNLIAGDDHGIFHTSDNGSHWIWDLSSTNVDALALNGKDLVAGTIGFGAFRRPLSEMMSLPPAWITQTSPLGTQGLGQIQFVTSAEGWIVAGNGSLLHTTNSGSSWAIVNPGGTDTVSFNTDNLSSLSPLCFVNPTTGWVMATSGQLQQAAGAVLFKTTNGGATWSKQPFAGWSTGFGVQFVDATHGWAEVVNGTSKNFTYSILRTTDGGNQWASIYTSSSALSYPCFIDANNGWAIIVTTGTFSIVRTTDGGATWNSQFSDNTPGTANRIQFVDANNGWVVGDSSKILHTTNGGSTWTRLTNSGSDPSSTLKSLFFLNGNTGWIGGQVASGGVPAFVLHTSNGGASWSTQGGASWSPPNKSPVQSNIVGLFFVDANTGWMTTHFGDLVKTTTGGDVTAVYENHEIGVPSHFALKQNYPNPFNPSTTIRYEITQPAHVTLKVYNVLGAEVETLVSENQNAGIYQVRWIARVPSGVYFYRINVGSWSETKKLLLLK